MFTRTQQRKVPGVQRAERARNILRHRPNGVLGAAPRFGVTFSSRRSEPLSESKGQEKCKSWKAQFQDVSVLVFKENCVWFSIFLCVPICCGVIADEIPKHVCSEHEIFGFWQCSNGIIVQNIPWKHYTPLSLRWILFACSFPRTLMLIFA